MMLEHEPLSQEPFSIDPELKKLGMNAHCWIIEGLEPLKKGAARRFEAFWEDAIKKLREQPQEQQERIRHHAQLNLRFNQAFPGGESAVPGNLDLQQLLQDADQKIPFINPLVAAYNLASLVTGLAMGAHDLSTIKGSIRLKICDGSESFTPLGSDQSIAVPTGAYAYTDEGGRRVICLMDIKQCNETKVTRKTSDILFLVQRPPTLSNKAMWDAQLFLHKILEQMKK